MEGVWEGLSTSESGEWRKDYLEVFLPGGHGGRTYSAELCTWTVNVDGVEIVEKDGTERVIYCFNPILVRFQRV